MSEARGTPPREPTALSGWLRSARTAAYWLASPIDRAIRRPKPGSATPPLWLRRHAGAPSQFRRSARDMASLLDTLNLPNGTDDVLDVGCGAGAMAAELARRMGPNARYVGFDVHAPSIRWCRESLRDDPRLSFELADVSSPYGGPSQRSAAHYRFPMDSGGAGFVLAKSVFTHLLEPEARHYLREIGRTLKGGERRGAVVTAFLFDTRPPGADRARRVFPHGGERVRWRRSYRPTAGVAYDRSLFDEMVREAGLRVLWTSLHFYPGSDRLLAQDILLLGH